MQYKYRNRAKKVESVKKKRRSNDTIWEEKKTINITSGSKDIVATLYMIRNLPIDKASIGDSSTFKMLFDNKETTVRFKYLGKETISTNIGKKQCYKIAISQSNFKVLKGSNSNLIWLTADANKVPVLAKFKIPVGNGKLKIKSATGLKN